MPVKSGPSFSEKKHTANLRENPEPNPASNEIEKWGGNCPERVGTTF
jgi:hypothetical protein